MMNVVDASASSAANAVGYNPLPSVVAVTADQHQALRSSSPAASSKMSDVLKRKNAPKRKSQISSRSKTRNQELHGETSSPATSSSVMQELINKATALGKQRNSIAYIYNYTTPFCSNQTNLLLK